MQGRFIDRRANVSIGVKEWAAFITNALIKNSIAFLIYSPFQLPHWIIFNE
jgi:hypothetical protein